MGKPIADGQPFSLIVQATVIRRVQRLQLGALLLQPIQLAAVGHLQAAIVGVAHVEYRIGDAMLAV